MADVNPPSVGKTSGPAQTGSEGLAPLGSGRSSPAAPSTDREDSSTAGITLAASHQASLMQGRPSFSPDTSTPQDQGVRGVKIGTLNAGDRYASTRQNSPETAQAASSGISGTASMSLNVPETHSTTSSTTRPTEFSTAPRNEPRRIPPPEADDSFIRSFNQSLRRAQRREQDPAPTLGSSGGNFSSSAPNTPASATPAPSPTTATEPTTQRYRFDVYDVHDMGGTPSRLSITDASGKSVGSYDLQPGNSTIYADLAPGDYRIEAQSGSRPGSGTGPDQLDNFHVDVFSEGPSLGGGGGPDLGSLGK